MKSLLFIIAVFFLLISSTLRLTAQTNHVSSKYKIGDCITPIDPMWSWFGKVGKIEDIVSSKKFSGEVYYLNIPESNIAKTGFFHMPSIDDRTVKVTSCPF